MATYTATVGEFSDMREFFPWAQGTVIASITGDATARVVTDAGPDYTVTYTGTGLAATGAVPQGGTYTSILSVRSGTPTGTLYLATPGNFAEIGGAGAYHVLDGNDVLTGNIDQNVLFAGFGGDDELYGLGGVDDYFFVGARAGASAMKIVGTAGTNDILKLIDNPFVAGASLDLRQSALSSIEEIGYDDNPATITIFASQIGTGLSPNASIGGDNGSFFDVVKNTDGPLDLSGSTIVGFVTVRVFGSAAVDVVSGTAAGDHFYGGGGADILNGLGGDDTFFATGAVDVFATFNGGAGNDTLAFEGDGPVVLAGFNAAARSIESLAAGGRPLRGNADANIFDLGGLVSVSGLNAVIGGKGSDTIIGSTFADLIRGGQGADLLIGGLGADIFDFNTRAGIGKKSHDVIGDFQQGLDRIDFSTMDADGNRPGKGVFSFNEKSGAPFSGAGPQLITKQVDRTGTDRDMTLVKGDVNGDGRADFRLEVTGLHKFVTADFVL